MSAQFPVRPARVAMLAVATLVAALISPLVLATAASGEVPYLITEVSITIAPASPVPAGEQVEVAVSVGSQTGVGVPVGDVQLSVDGEPFQTASLVDGSASFSIPATDVTPGKLEVVAQYTGDETWLPTSGRTDVTVHFNDYYPRGTFYDDIQWLSGQGISRGYPEGGFRPTAPVSRQAMAAFLYRAANPGMTPSACVTAPFTDVLATHPFCGEILWLAGEGISTGYSDGSFRPGVAVTRQAMAAFLYRFSTGDQSAPACSTAPLNDTLPTHPFCGAISWLLGKQVTTGYSDGSFRPGAPVSRQAMAAFLHRLFGDAIRVLAEGTVEVAAANVTVDEGAQSVVILDGPVPDVGDGLVVPLGADGSNGVVGKVTARFNEEQGVRLEYVTATLDEVYESISIVSSSSHNGRTWEAGPSFVNAPFNGSPAAATCDASVSDLVSLTPELLDIDADFELKNNRFSAPELSLAITYSPQFTLAAQAAVDGSCSWEYLAASIPISIMPPIVADVVPYVEVGVQLQSGLQFTAGTVMRYEFTAKGSDVSMNTSNTPFSNGLSADAQASLSVEAGIAVQTKLAKVVGLEGRVGLNASANAVVLGGSSCFEFTIALKAALTAVLDLWVKEWSVTLVEGTLAEKTLSSACPGADYGWEGTQTEVWSGVLSDPFNGSLEGSVDATAVWQVLPNGNFATLTGTSAYHVNDYGMAWCGIFIFNPQYLGAMTNVQNLGSFPSIYFTSETLDGVEQSNGYPRLEIQGDFHYVDPCGDVRGESTRAFTYSPGDGEVPSFPNNFFRGGVRERCDGQGMAIPQNSQAMRFTRTITCRFYYGQWGYPAGFYSGALTLELTMEFRRNDCDLTVDSDTDGMGDCEEFDNNRNPHSPAG